MVKEAVNVVGECPNHTPKKKANIYLDPVIDKAGPRLSSEVRLFGCPIYMSATN